MNSDDGLVTLCVMAIDDGLFVTPVERGDGGLYWKPLSFEQIDGKVFRLAFGRFEYDKMSHTLYFVFGDAGRFPIPSVVLDDKGLLKRPSIH